MIAACAPLSALLKARNQPLHALSSQIIPSFNGRVTLGNALDDASIFAGLT